MKTYLKTTSVLVVALAGFIIGAVLTSEALPPPKPSTSINDLKIENTNNSVALTIQKAGNVASNALEIRRGGRLEFAIPGTNVPAGLKSNLGIQSGTAVSTNEFLRTNFFSPVFSSAPVVIPVGNSNAAAHIVAITSSNVIFGFGATNKTLQWIAIGPP